MWPNKKARSVRFSLWETAQVDKRDYEEIWDAISPLRSPPLSRSFFFYDTCFPYSLLALFTYFNKCLVISTFQSHFIISTTSLIGVVCFATDFLSWAIKFFFKVVFTVVTLFHHLYIWCTDKMYRTTMVGGVGLFLVRPHHQRQIHTVRFKTPYRKCAKCFNFAQVKRRSTLPPFTFVPLCPVSKTQFSPSVLWVLVLLQWCWSRPTPLTTSTHAVRGPASPQFTCSISRWCSLLCQQNGPKFLCLLSNVWDDINRGLLNEHKWLNK